MKTAILILQGGLGNQLFQIAAAVAWRREHGARVLLDSRTGFFADKFMRTFTVGQLLDIPSLGIGYSPWAALPFRYAAKVAWKLGASPTRLLPVLADRHAEILEIWLRSSHNGYRFLDGYWQNSAHAQSARSHLFAAIRPSWLQSSRPGHELQLPPGRSHLVGMHLRLRYCYSSDNKFVAALPTLPAEYFLSAVQFVKRTLPAPHFLVCADTEIADADLSVLGLDSMTNLTGLGRSEAEDFEVLRHCPSLVLSNSSFAWWAALLRGESDGITVCPDLRRYGQLMDPLPGWITLPTTNQVLRSARGLLR
jgi:hypothetical protein